MNLFFYEILTESGEGGIMKQEKAIVVFSGGQDKRILFQFSFAILSQIACFAKCNACQSSLRHPFDDQKENKDEAQLAEQRINGRYQLSVADLSRQVDCQQDEHKYIQSSILSISSICLSFSGKSSHRSSAIYMVLKSRLMNIFI